MIWPANDGGSERRIAQPQRSIWDCSGRSARPEKLQTYPALLRKTGRAVPFEITEPTREALSVWLDARGRRDDDWLFPSRSLPGEPMTTGQYARLLDRWLTMIDLEPRA